MDEAGWDKVSWRLSRGYVWEVQFAKRRNTRGRSIRGMVLGMRKGLKETGVERMAEREGIIVGMVKLGGTMWKVIGVYVRNEEFKKLMQEIGGIIEEREGGVRIIMGGDFNARTRRQGGGVWEEEEWREKRERKSKDLVINREGRRLVEVLVMGGGKFLMGILKDTKRGSSLLQGVDGVR